MDMHYEGGSGILVVTNRAYIYLLNSLSLQLIRTLVSPTNDKMFKIEVFLANNWLILFNQKLTALLQNTDLTNHHVWPDCDALDVRAGRMITVKSNITLWQTQGRERERAEVHQRGEIEHVAERNHIPHRHSFWDES